MPEPIPALIEPVVNNYLKMVEDRLPDFVTGFYLQGSLALGAFNPELSDIDFIALVSRSWNEQDIVRLRELHNVLQAIYQRWPLEGIYVRMEDLAQGGNAAIPHLIQLKGKLKPGTHLELNHVDWWLLKQRGIRLKGPEIEALELKVEWDLLLAGMKHNLNTYWMAYTRRPDRIAWLFTEYGVAWAVLGVLRQYYSFKENDITSKSGAGEYALTQLPPEWHRLIREALNLRQQDTKSFYRTRTGRAVEAFRFMKYIIRECNSL